MNKQQKIYILTGAVVTVWGLVGFQIFNHLQPKKEPVAIIATQPFINENRIQERVQYTVSRYDRDPFLGNVYKKKKKKKKKLRPRNNMEPIVFPDILYQGIVSGNNQTSYVVSINGQQEIVKVGQTYQNLKIIKGSNKQLVVRFKGKQQTFLLQQ